MSSERVPNVLLVLADDLGVGDLGAYGGDLIRTPHVDALARSGVACDAMYAAAATDTPSRAGLLTGRYGARLGLPASSTPETPARLPAGLPTLATVLREQGYATGLFGQWRLGEKPGSLPADHGFDTFAGTLYGTDVAPLAWYDDGTVTDPDLDIATSTRRITRAALDFVGDRRGGRVPWFAVVSHLVPHAPFRAERRVAGTSDAGTYGDVVEQLDEQVGELLRRLRRDRDRRRTLVIFTSDNGPRYEGRNQLRRGRKPEVFDGGVRVPFIAAWLDTEPGRRGRRDDVPRSLLDLMPSLCTVTGAPLPPDLDGEDLSGLFEGRSPGRGPVFLFFQGHLNAVRSGRWKFHRQYGESGTSYMPQLYDVRADLRENYSVAARHPDVVADLTARIEAVAADVAGSVEEPV